MIEVILDSQCNDLCLPSVCIMTQSSVYAFPGNHGLD